MIDETQASHLVMMEVRTRFQWPLTPQQSYDWVRNIKQCKDLEQAKRLILRLADEGKLAVPAFRALLAAETPWTTASSVPANVETFKGAAQRLRNELVQAGDARAKAVLSNVDAVRASMPKAWRPLSEDEQQRRKAKIIAQLHATVSIERSHPATAPAYDPQSPLDEDLRF